MQVNKNQVYQSHNYTFKNFILLSEDEKRMVWQWRNEGSIRSLMYTTDIIPWENHLRFIESLKSREDRYYWLIYKDDTAIGVFDITDYDKEKDFAEVGYYANPELHGVGFEMLRECFWFYFHIINIKALTLSVRKDNCRAALLDQFLGMKFTSSMEMEINDELVQFHVCERFTKEDFNDKYRLTKADYKQYIKEH